MRHGSPFLGRVENIAFFLRTTESVKSKHKPPLRQKEKSKSRVSPPVNEDSFETKRYFVLIGDCSVSNMEEIPWDT